MVNVEFHKANSTADFSKQFMLRIDFDQRTSHVLVLKDTMTREQVSEALLSLAEKVLQS